MVPALQVAGLFLTMTAALAFTAWAEVWLASTPVSINKRQPHAKRSDALAVADRRNEGASIQAA